MPYCTGCGKPINEGASFCKWCGRPSGGPCTTPDRSQPVPCAPAPPIPPQSQVARSNARSSRAVLLVVLIAVGAVIAAVGIAAGVRGYSWYRDLTRKIAVSEVVANHYLTVRVNGLEQQFRLSDLMWQYHPDENRIVRPSGTGSFSNLNAFATSDDGPRPVSVQGEHPVYLATFESRGGNITLAVNVESGDIEPADEAAERLFAVQHLDFHD